MVNGMIAAGATCKGWWTQGEPARGKDASAPFGGAPRIKDRRTLIEDPAMELILVAAMPAERASIAIEAMHHGKNVMVDKPAAVTLNEVTMMRRVAAETRRIWSVCFSNAIGFAPR